ncbi:helix-turn-helix transcriptional regulator [Niastella caeni]|uniref:Helix-turn-helix transcriptional regulator n=1 Tax=Niastella caeni TaxID=2569763 RepID=A0A4S8H9L4_9BACT|nr:helix-turn-helix transcriptional regulator [Niastella caeni]THU31580.1 helix-turn-helix transcriptional regulator [Niastella caeni]
MINNVKQMREQCGYTQEQLANLVGASRQSIISIEKGHYIPTTIMALKLAFSLGVGVEELFILEKKDWKG